jgi:YD repeat-containing protein
MRKIQVDAVGRIVGDKTHMDTADIATLRASIEAGTATLASVMATVTPDDAHDPVTYTVFDGAGRQRYTVDAMGAVVETVYDAAGRLAATHRYANAITISSTLKAKLAAGDPTALADVAALLVADDARDQRNYNLYNTAGQLAFTLDASNVAVRYTYATSGQVATARTEGRLIAVDATIRAKLDAGIATSTDIVDLASNSYDQGVYNVYDAAGRLRYAVTVMSSSSTVVT